MTRENIIFSVKAMLAGMILVSILLAIAVLVQRYPAIGVAGMFLFCSYVVGALLIGMLKL